MQSDLNQDWDMLAELPTPNLMEVSSENLQLSRAGSEANMTKAVAVLLQDSLRTFQTRRQGN
jgi:hypothetical protein